MVLLFGAMSVSTVQANDYLEHSEHYTVMNVGNGVYRFRIPVWVYGRANNYYLDSKNLRNDKYDSYVWYSLKPNAKRGGDEVHRIATVAAPQKGMNMTKDVNSTGEGFIYVHAGSVVIQNMKDGTKLPILAGDGTYWDQWKNSLKLKRMNDDDHKYITYIEFDWYPPQELAGKNFYWGVSAHLYKENGDSYETEWWNKDDRLNMSDPQSPELFTPYLYALDEEGATGYGNAAVQYATYQTAVSYHTSYDPAEVPVSNNAGSIIVPTADTVQRQFFATFRVNLSNDSNVQIYTLKTNALNIPAYHRVYDFHAEEILDDQQSVTGRAQLSWAIRYPGAEDLVESDMFQVERAFLPDFSDAQTIAVESFDSQTGTYSVEDDPLHASVTDTAALTAVNNNVSEKGTFTAYDANGDAAVEYEAVLTSRQVFEPGRPVYYRVRRASAAVWGWQEGFAMIDTLTQNSYLAPLADTQLDYTLDPEYETNRKVHFQFKLENKPIQVQPEKESECELKATATAIHCFMPITLHFTGTGGVNPADYLYKIYYLPPEGSLQSTYLPLENGVLQAYAESGSMVQISIINKQDKYTVYTLDLIGKLDNKAVYIADVELYPAGDGHNLYANVTENEAAMQTAFDEFVNQHPLPDTARHTLYTKLDKKVTLFNSSDAHCNWDRNAMIFLRRVTVETNDTLEFLVPADSVKRQEDGSWVAHMTDVANLACAHYRYAVRIDQTGSALKVLDPADLLPHDINGPDLYYNEVAQIARFDATQGTDRFGIILTWEPTAGGVDVYELSRREAGSTADFEPVKTTEENDYRDNDVVPGVEYEYQLKVSYTCNDTTTTNFATATGSRSPYGLIAGRIHYSDGTGCAGIKVRLESEGMSDLETVTDGSGRYLFDSLLYGAGKDYSIIPTSSYAQFRFNNTSMTTASITLNAKNPIAEGIVFDNISSVRFSGRILYQTSTIPVRNANLLLDGKPVETAGGPLKTDASGNFVLQVPENHPFTIQAVKEGHVFEGDGFVRMNNDSNLVLEKALDGVRIWDATKVRLAGRLVGGKDQAAQPLGFGMSKNNLGDDLQLVLELEGDNISQIVRDENDLTRDTLEFTVPHLAYKEFGQDTTGTTKVHYQKKRIIINADPKTGEYCADLFPVRYKVTQATARGYATLFAEGKTSEVIDLTNGPTQKGGDMYDGRTTKWNEKFSITYRSPVEISCIQMRYGLAQPFFGEQFMTRQSVLNEQVKIPLVTKDSVTGEYYYTFGHPVFPTANYTFRITAHEDYYYNNDRNNKHDEVRIKGGALKVYNGLHESEEMQIISALFPKWEQATSNGGHLSAQFDEEGQVDITIPVDNVSFRKAGEQAVRTLDISVESDGRYIEKQGIAAYITGNRTKGRDYMVKVGEQVKLLDVLRDPPGAKSSAFIEKGASFDFSYTFNLKAELGIKLDYTYGTSHTMVFGTYLAVTPGFPSAYTGNTVNTSVVNSFSVPITIGASYKNGGSYTFTTNERISTASDDWFVGSRGDIYIGTSHSMLYELTDAVKPIDSLTYATLGAHLTDSVDIVGSATTVAEGRGLDGTKYYLVSGEEVGASMVVNGNFAYTQDYILTVLLPQLMRRRNELIYTGDSATVQAIADSKGTEVYWSTVLPTDTTYALTNYKKIIPTGDKDSLWLKVDRVAQYNTTIASWVKLIADNEYEKISVLAGANADLVGNYSISNGVSLSHTDTYESTRSVVIKWEGLTAGFNADLVTKNMTNAVDAASQTMADQLQALVQRIMNGAPANHPGAGGDQASPIMIDTRVPGATGSWKIEPVFNFNVDRSPDKSKKYTRTVGFTLEPDEYSYMNIDVFRRREANEFNDLTEENREHIDDALETGYESEDYVYGSYVYRLNGGATKCPWEGPDEAIFFTRGGQPVQMSQGTLRLENPQLDILNPEVSDIPHDQPAIIKILLGNETQTTLENYVVFKLVLVDASNPNGAKVLMDGFPLTGDGRSIKLNPGQTIEKTIEVYAGQGYDYENLTLMLASQCDLLNFVKAPFSVHFQPTSCNVNISAPHDKWVMNTLSPKDSTGWYLPVVIDGYDINYPNFDHIEFQYKLTKQSDDGWVNLCSFYANDTLYNEASGSKAMMKAGRIENIAFYGERDPMEQQYDLRAVSFCRYGTSFLTKSSPVLTGIKDTRPPRVFGEPAPANSILGVGDNLLLRFNEPIAGNYLDEDNNFQITGITNTTGLAASTALHFDGKASATTKAKRDLTETDFTIDLMIRPTVANNRAEDMILFETGDEQVNKQLILTKDNHLRLVRTNGQNFLAKSSKKLEDLRAFTRVVCVYKKGGKTRFFLGTEEVTSGNLGSSETTEEGQDRSAFFRFGRDYDGDMLEARIWTKALTPEEISATANKSLTGYERELLAYYRMNEGKGETVTDQANGATLFLEGCSWNKQKGYSLKLDGDSVRLNGNLLGRSKIYDETLMFWFKAETEGTLFSAARHEATDSTAATGTLLALENGNLVLRSGTNDQMVNAQMVNGTWHHFVLTVNRTFNNVSLFLDGKIVQSFDATDLDGITGAMWLGGNGFKGNIDEFVIFEQALPKSLVELYDDNALTGDEMGLFAYLPFEEQYTNPNGIIEQRFSINDRRIFKDATGKVINKIVPLINAQMVNDQMVNELNAPVKSKGVLNKLYFDWSFNNDELMINVLNHDYEVNKQSIYVTVRDVEDLNGNPMVSPVTWTAFVDRNSLKWSVKKLNITSEDNAAEDVETRIDIINQSGKRHTYTIESLPSWLTVSSTYGAMDPLEEQTLRLTFNSQIAVGEYSDIIYLTDEDGLSEPLQIEYIVNAVCPYEDVDRTKYPLNMAVCGQVKIGDVFDTDSQDKVFALYRNECIGTADASNLFMTVYGNEQMKNKPVNFVLWQASTGKTFNLNTSLNGEPLTITFAEGAVYGCGDSEPVLFVTNGSEMQNIVLNPGWNWTSFNIDVQQNASGVINNIMTAAEPWSEGDLMKNPYTRNFCVYSDSLGRFTGSLYHFYYIWMHMIYTKNGNTMRVYGNTLPEDSMHITLNGNGAWNAFPCLFKEATSVTEALADYYQYATPGDMLKSHDHFAVFTNNKRWEGDLTAVRPGEGYMFRRLGSGAVNVRFFNKATSNAAPQRAPKFRGNAATNMTMIATLDRSGYRETEIPEFREIRVFVGDELAAVAQPLSLQGEPEETYYFFTIQSDKSGTLRFELNGETLIPVGTSGSRDSEISYSPNAHAGSLKAPVILQPTDDRPYKILENQHVVIIRNNEKYDVTGKKME